MTSFNNHTAVFFFPGNLENQDGEIQNGVEDDLRVKREEFDWGSNEWSDYQKCWGDAYLFFLQTLLKKNTFISQAFGNTTVSSYINAILCNPEWLGRLLMAFWDKIQAVI